MPRDVPRIGVRHGVSRVHNSVLEMFQKLT